MLTRSLIVAAVLTYVAAVAPGCGGGGTSSTVVVGDPVGDTVADGQATGVDLADQAEADFNGNEYSIVLGKSASILAALNDGEIAQASFAADVVQDGDVFDFANMLIDDHDAANVDLDDSVRFEGIAYIPSPAADALAIEANRGLAELRATPPDDVDFKFAEIQVRMHASAQVMLDELAGVAGPGPLANYIQDTQVMVDSHLRIAEDLLSTFY